MQSQIHVVMYAKNPFGEALDGPGEAQLFFMAAERPVDSLLVNELEENRKVTTFSCHQAQIVKETNDQKSLTQRTDIPTLL